jgi:hypothetical protein
MTTKSKVDGAAVPLPPQSIDLNKLSETLAKGKPGDEALEGALNPYTSEKAVNGPLKDEAASAEPSAPETPSDAS